MKTPAFVTFTGLDAKTDIERMLALSALYPVEWGILFSPKRQGEGRYPALAAIARYAHQGLRLAAHVCGAGAASVLDDGKFDEVEGLPHGMFDRIQVNTARREPETHEAAAFARWVGAKDAILQCRGDAFPQDDTVNWLFDVSGGVGREPASWKVDATTPAFVGYAGGMGPDTVRDALAGISSHHPEGKPFWIDMETHVRTQDVLDLDKCQAVLTAVYGPR